MLSHFLLPGGLVYSGKKETFLLLDSSWPVCITIQEETIKLDLGRVHSKMVPRLEWRLDHVQDGYTPQLASVPSEPPRILPLLRGVLQPPDSFANVGLREASLSIKYGL